MAFSAKAERDGGERPYAHLDLTSPPRRPRWIRFGVILGVAPGSMGAGTIAALWRSDPHGGRGGYTLRLFYSVQRPCLTMLIHWRGWSR